MATKQPKELVLFEGEEVLYSVEGNAYTDSANPLAKLIMLFVKIFWIIFGVKLKTYLIATNKRFIQVDKKTILWGFLTGDIAVITLNKKSIQSIGYQHTRRWFLFKTSYFVLASITSVIHITHKGSREALSKTVSEFSRLVLE